MQEHENLPRDFSLFQFLKDKAQLTDEQTYSLLRHFNFSLDETKKKIEKLSPGGRARLLLAYFAAIGANILVLDEPSNHLDLEAIEALKETLKTYTGTVILVSHDRYFIEEAELTCLYVLEKGKLKFVPNYQDYLTKITNEVKLKLSQL
jgi:ATP-binding cassette subfamily F protein 3